LEPLVFAEAVARGEERDAAELRRLVVASEDEPGAAASNQDWALRRRVAELGANAPLRMFYLGLLDMIEERLEPGWRRPGGGPGSP